MPVLDVIVEGDNCWPDLLDKEVLYLGAEARIGLAALAGGMASGRPSVSIRINLPDGRVVWAQTSLRLLQVAVGAFTARYGDQTLELEGDGTRLA